MPRSRSSFVALLFAALLVASSAFAVAPGPGRLDPNVSPSFETVKLKLDPAQKSYTGSVRIDVDVAATTSEFSFNSEGITIGSLHLASATGEIATTVGPEKDGVVTVTTAKPIAPGKYTLSIDFTNDFGTRAVGLYKTVKDGRSYAFTQFEAADGRRAFPMWDEPAYKIPFELTLTIPAKDDAVANTLPETTARDADGWKTIHFHATRPLPSYLVAIAVGPFDFVEIKGMKVPGRVVTPAGEGRLGEIAAREAPKIIDALSRYFTIDYPYEKLDLIAVPEFWPGAMENAGAITFADRILLVDPDHATPGQMRELVYVTAHEMTHQWFGDLVTMKWWDDLWLNESFADFLGTKITTELVPWYEFDLVQLQRVERIHDLDARPSVGAIRQKVTSADQGLTDVGLAYDKGDSILTMVEQWIGPETFRKGLISYLHAHAWGNATGSDLWSALSKAAGYDVSGPLESFLNQRGFPLVDVRLEGGGKVRLSQTRFGNAGVKMTPETWSIPVSIRYSDGTSVKTSTFVLTKPAETFTLGAKKVAWIDPNANGNGYYRWFEDPSRIRDLAKNASAWLTPRERIDLLGNLSSLLDAGRVHGDAYLAMASELANDPDPEVVSQFLDGLDRINLAFVTDAERPAFARYLRHSLRPTLDRYGLEPRKGEKDTVTIVRPDLIEWLGTQGADRDVRAFAAKQAASYMKDPSSIDPSIAGVVLRVAAWDGDLRLLDAYEKKIESARSPEERGRYLHALSAFQKPAVRVVALDFVLHGGLRPNEMMRIPSGFATTDASHRFIYQWFTSHFDEIASRIPPAFVGRLPRIAGGCDARTLASAEKFFGEKAHQARGTARTLARVADEVNSCVQLRRRDGRRVARYLESAK